MGEREWIGFKKIVNAELQSLRYKAFSFVPPPFNKGGKTGAVRRC